jgi:chromosome segregation ATPase
MKKNIPLLVFFLMAGGFIFSVIRYVAALQANARLDLALKETKHQVGVLEGRSKEDQDLIAGLRGEKTLLLDSLKEAEEKISEAKQKNAQNEERIFSLTKELDALEKEGLRTKEEKAALEEKMTQLEAQNAALDARLRSIPELKKAIREVKIQMRKSRIVSASRSARRREVIGGNAGYLIKDGVSTQSHRIIIEVRPAQ